MKDPGGAKYRYLREVDAYGRRSLRFHYALALGAALLLAVRATLHFNGSHPIAGATHGGRVMVLGSIYGLVMGGLFLHLLLVLVSGRNGRLTFDREFEGEGRRFSESRDRVAARLLEAGYRLESVSGDEGGMTFVPARVQWRLARLLIPDVRRIPHRVRVEDAVGWRGRGIRVEYALDVWIMDTGEGEHAERLFDYLEGRTPVVEVRRTLNLWSEASLWLAAAAIIGAFVSYPVGRVCVWAAVLFTLGTVPIAAFQRRRICGTSIAFAALLLSSATLLLHLI